MASLMAFPDTVIVDNKAGIKNGTTSIFYTADSLRRAILWERVVNKPWTRIDLVQPPIFNSPDGDPKLGGTFYKTLTPGQVYQVVMYHDGIDPNVFDPFVANPEEKPDALLTVVARLKDPAETNLIVSQDQTFGGTWFRKIVKTTVPTFFVLQVSKMPPFTDTQGVVRFAAPLETAFDMFAANHDRQVEPLLPGNDHFFLVHLLDVKGNWQTITGQFRTKQRKVTIIFDKLGIINDGANSGSDNTADFRIWVMEGDTEVKGFNFGDVDNFKIATLQSIDIISFCPAFTLGPKDVTDDTNDVGILIRGLCKHNLEDNEPASNFTFGDNFPNPKASVSFQDRFPFPTGGGENVQNVPFFVKTRHQVVDALFAFEVKTLFTVDYM